MLWTKFCFILTSYNTLQCHVLLLFVFICDFIYCNYLCIKSRICMCFTRTYMYNCTCTLFQSFTWPMLILRMCTLYVKTFTRFSNISRFSTLFFSLIYYFMPQLHEVLAYASFCKEDQHGRPIAGYINICPWFLNSPDFDRERGGLVSSWHNC